jgi:flagellar motor protein MotB
VAYLVKAPRVGRSQGAVIFWGLVSAFFASAFCYYYLKNRTNEESARTLNDQVIVLQGERDSLSSERDKIEAATSDTEKQLQARADFLQQKETKLAEEESEIDAMGTNGHAAQSQAQAEGVKRFDDAARQLAAGTPGADVSLLGGRPLLRLPSPVFFAAGDAHLLPGGKTILDQAAQAVGGPGARFEMRVETFSDSGSESSPADADNSASKKDAAAVTGVAGASDATTKIHYANAWDLTAARAAAIDRYLHDQGTLPFQDVLVMGRGDTLSASGSKDGHAHSRLVEITLAPVPAPFHAPDPAKISHGKKGAPAPDSSPDQGAP